MFYILYVLIFDISSQPTVQVHNTISHKIKNIHTTRHTYPYFCQEMTTVVTSENAIETVLQIQVACLPHMEISLMIVQKSKPLVIKWTPLLVHYHIQTSKYVYDSISPKTYWHFLFEFSKSFQERCV